MNSEGKSERKCWTVACYYIHIQQHNQVRKLKLKLTTHREKSHTSLFSTNTNAWQEARISTVRTGTLLMSDSKSVVSANPTTPENSYKMGIKALYCRTWSKIINKYHVLCGYTMSSDVSVPVLSKQHISTYRRCRKLNKNHCKYMIYIWQRKGSAIAKTVNLQVPSQQMVSEKVRCKKFHGVPVQSEKY